MDFEEPEMMMTNMTINEPCTVIHQLTDTYGKLIDIAEILQTRTSRGVPKEHRNLIDKVFTLLQNEVDMYLISQDEIKRDFLADKAKQNMKEVKDNVKPLKPNK